MCTCVRESYVYKEESQDVFTTPIHTNTNIHSYRQTNIQYTRHSTQHCRQAWLKKHPQIKSTFTDVVTTIRDTLPFHFHGDSTRKNELFIYLQKLILNGASSMKHVAVPFV